MNVNFIYQIEYKIEDNLKIIFNEIINKTVNTLKIDKDYCFSLIVVNDEKIHVINREYRHIDRPTDVISFAVLDSKNNYETIEEDDELGDIFINIDAIRRQAKEYGHSFEREFCFLFLHGLLHLLGYDHMNVEDEKEMFMLQDVILDGIISK